MKSTNIYHNALGQPMTREAFHALQLAMRFNYCDYYQLLRYAKARNVSEPLLRLARQLVAAEAFDKANSTNQADQLPAFLRRQAA